MRVRGVVGHQVDDDVDTPFLRLDHELAEVSHRPEPGIDGTVIGDVVAIIAIR
jgi:hypothetical protein